ncbi:MAG TPA: efflux RND transporter permease subunit [Lentimicrobium sp.]|nr:efflux RND transporter permease subunit [Lentimicrobium sp.]
MNLSVFALKNKPLIQFLLAILLVGGILSFWSMSKLEDPEIKVKQAMVITVYPGASAHQVELEVTDLMEKAIRSMDNVANIDSKSVNDISQITVELDRTLNEKEIQQAWDMLRRKVSDVQSSLPAGAREPMVLDGFGDVYGMFYAITSDGFSEQELSEYVDMVKRELEQVKGVERIALYGKRNECINVNIKEDQLGNMGVYPAEIFNTLNTHNKTVYAGYFNSGDYRLKVNVNDEYKSIEDIQNLIIQGHEDDQLTLRDVADISIGLEEPVRNSLFWNSQKAVGLSIAVKHGTDITKVGKSVEKRLSELQSSRLPLGIDFHKVFFQPDIVRASLSTFTRNLIESVVIVVVVLMFTMGIRSGLILGFLLVITVMGTFPFFNMVDGVLQRVSLGAFIVAMGMLVDNAIVIIDGIMVDLKSGVPAPECYTNMTKKTAMPLLGATLIAILAFFPIFLSPDTAGVYVRDLFIVLALSLLLSWILALVQVPIQAQRRIRHDNIRMSDKDPYDSKPYRRLKSVLSWALDHKTVTIALAVVLMAISVACIPLVPQLFFPDMSYSQLYIEYKMPEGTSSETVENNLEKIEKHLHSKKEIVNVVRSIGGTPSRYNLVRSIAEPGLSYGELIVDYNDAETLVDSMPSLQQWLTDNCPEAFVRAKRYNLMYKKFPIEVMFTGPDPAVLRDLSEKAQDIMRSNPATTLVTNDWEDQTPVINVNYNQPVARNLGLSRSDVGISLLSATDGIPMGVFNDGTYRKTIYVHTTDADRKRVKQLDNIPVWSLSPKTPAIDKENLQGMMTGSLSREDMLSSSISPVPLSQATKGISMTWEEPVVRRHNGQRAIKAQCNNAQGFLTEEARKAIKKDIETIKMPEGYSMEWAGEYQASSEAKQYLFKQVPLAIILMVFILILLFKDFKKPLIIILCQPLIIIGVVFGMLISGKEFGFVAIVGSLGIIGMMVRNGIVLIDEIGRQIVSGIEPRKALLDSSALRFRPVMMASVATAVGMIPLLRDTLFGSLAVTIMGGLIVGTIITLVFLPVLYAVFYKIKPSRQS